MFQNVCKCFCSYEWSTNQNEAREEKKKLENLSSIIFLIIFSPVGRINKNDESDENLSEFMWKAIKWFRIQADGF